jgi:hypothetical protein
VIVECLPDERDAAPAFVAASVEFVVRVARTERDHAGGDERDPGRGARNLGDDTEDGVDAAPDHAAERDGNTLREPQLLAHRVGPQDRPPTKRCGQYGTPGRRTVKPK